MAGVDRSTIDRLIPHVVFTDPQLAHVGLNEREAQRQGVAVRIAKLPMKNVLRTEATDETDGFMKILINGKNDQILGFTMIGAEAAEVMTVVQTAMLAALPYPKLRDAVIAHLSNAEGLGPLLSGISAA
jgi:pyruvate/2-oxoglutarate dehydrogenase complex dihydrolipoamide dehydrogenase (E3) component